MTTLYLEPLLTMERACEIDIHDRVMRATTVSRLAADMRVEALKHPEGSTNRHQASDLAQLLLQSQITRLKCVQEAESMLEKFRLVSGNVQKYDLVSEPRGGATDSTTLSTLQEAYHAEWKPLEEVRLSGRCRTNIRAVDSTKLQWLIRQYMEFHKHFKASDDEYKMLDGKHAKLMKKLGLWYLWITDDFELVPKSEIAEDEECPNCKESLHNGEPEHKEVLRLACDEKHIFGRGCIEGWFQDHQDCPLCRKAVVLGKASFGLKRHLSDQLVEDVIMD